MAGTLSSCTAELTGAGLSASGGTGAAAGASGPTAGTPPIGDAADAALAQCAAQTLPNSPLALLTRAQYENTVFDLLGDDSKPTRDFPPENQVQGFNDNTSSHQASPLLVEKYLAAAESLAERAVSDRLGTLAPCTTDKLSCGRSFVRDFGRRAFRRPLGTTESQLFDDLFARTLQQSGYAMAVQLVLEAILQSPQFLYRVDTLATAPTPESGAVALGAYELASRLSYFLTGSMPDDPLLDAAANNQLASDQEVDLQARRLLESPRARAVVREFHHQWLGLDALPSLVRDASELASDESQLGSDWLASLDRFVDHVYWESGNLSEFFSSKLVYLNSRLSKLYAANVAGMDFTGVELADRAGISTQPALMALLAHGNQSAPVLRGVYILERLMCVSVPPPPPSVNNTPPDPDPNATTRERFRVHTEKPECAGCHALIDGIGFGFEAYDQLGRYRTRENGIDLDLSGEVLISDDATLAGSFVGAGELAARLAHSQRARDCVATNWYRFAFGRLETENDRCSLDEVKHRFSSSSGDLRELLLAITRSVAFRYRPPINGALQ